MSLFDSASLVVTPNGTKASKLYSIIPTDGSGDLSVTRATTAARVNSSGLVESSAVNVPRLDYTASTCPSILVEGQRTNLALRSEEFDNASWTTNSNQVTISANAITAPNATLTADAILTTTTSATHYVQQRTGSATAGTTYTMSVYVKKLGYDYCRIETSNTASAYAIFRFSTKELTIAGGQVVANSGKVTEMSDGWFRIQMSILPIASATWRWWVECLNDVGSQSFVGDTTKGLYVWGFQFEAGSNATSYIPTTTASVTRNADLINKTGISSLIGQTEGTIFADVNIKYIGIPTRNIANLTSGTSNFLSLSFLNTNVLRVTIRANAGTQYNVSTSALPIGSYKLAGTYKAGELKLYVNGALIGTNTNASVSWSSALDRLNLDNSVLGNDNFSDNIKSVALWETALTSQECINLTTI